MALVAGLICFALLDSPLGVIALALGAVVEIGESVLWYRYLKRFRVRTGVESLPGQLGEAVTDCRPGGQVRVRGELWRALADPGVDAGATIRVTGVEGLTLSVVPDTRRMPEAVEGAQRR